MSTNTETPREPEWAAQCRQCANLLQTLGGRIWKCRAARIEIKDEFRSRMGYCADARANDGVCEHGQAFVRRAGDDGVPGAAA